MQYEYSNRMGNIRSSVMFPEQRNDLGDIWGDLMTTAVGVYGQQTQRTIAQSQAAQADAAARIAAANAAAAQAATPTFSPWLLLPVGLGAALLIAKIYAKKKGHI